MFPENSNFASPTKLLILGILLLRILRGIYPFRSELGFNFLRLRTPLLCLSVTPADSGLKIDLVRSHVRHQSAMQSSNSSKESK